VRVLILTEDFVKDELLLQPIIEAMMKEVNWRTIRAERSESPIPTQFRDLADGVCRIRISQLVCEHTARRDSIPFGVPR
jgi:hypothetical protein